MTPKSIIPNRFRPAKVPGADVLRENRKLVEKIERRALLRGSLSLGALTFLTGCDISNRDSVQRVLQAMSGWNDRVQGFLFSPTRLAPEYPASMVSKPPRFNAYIPRDKIPDVDGEAWKLELTGLIGDKHPWSLKDINALPEVTQRTRHVCVEGWDYIGEGLTRRQSSSASNVPPATTAASTWRPRSIRRHSSPLNTLARRSRRISAFPFACGPPRSSASRRRSRSSR